MSIKLRLKEDLECLAWVKVGAGLEHGLPNPQVVAFSFLPSIFMEHVLTTRQLSTISLASWTRGKKRGRGGIMPRLWT